MQRENLSGKTFGRLTAVEFIETRKGQSMWKCVCSCPNHTEVIVSAGHLKSGHTTSCGCFKNEIVAAGTHKTHGHTGSRLHSIWFNMKKRCTNTNSDAYKNYGGRGISVCDKWMSDFKSFYDWSLANGYDDSLTIDRINNDGNYEPSNCRWVSRKVQNCNSRNNRYLTYNGITKTITDWAADLGIERRTITARLDKLGWSVEAALSTPLQSQH